MRKLVFTIDGFADAYIGYTGGHLWNGWATPYFEKDEAERVMAGYNQDLDEPDLMYYDEVGDAFVVYTEGHDNYDYWQGADIRTQDGIKHLYGIGAYSWVWDDDGGLLYKKSLARQVAEFMYDDDDDMWVIAKKFSDLEVYADTIRIMRNDDIGESFRYEQLKGILEL